ncbi:MAG: beta-aspartyl-peptidase [Candidatus Pelethousia sp.]|nr:beta-aspartyl-peptidase [Candidatus Pelethousia sp.]
MIVLVKNADVYAPKHVGRRDILICDQKIAAIEEKIEISAPDLKVMDVQGKALVPGFLDGHMHITGGGGEDGYASRVPECRLSELVSVGITTVLGLLGTDSISRSLENLYAKACALDNEGISAYMLTGGYRYPSPTITGNVMKDIYLINKVIGVKIAASDHRSSALSSNEFARLATEARIGGLISGKPGLVVVHMGNSEKTLQPIYDMLNSSDVPINNILPTHCGRGERLFQAAVEYGKRGGNFDLTAVPQNGGAQTTAAEWVKKALDAGVDIKQITISSDAYGSQPKFNERMECIGIEYAKGPLLHEELKRMVQEWGMPLEIALMPITQNVAERMGLRGKKGVLEKGSHADFVVMDKGLNICHVFAKGKAAVLDGKILMKGVYE